MSAITRLLRSPWIQCLGIALLFQAVMLYSGVVLNHVQGHNIIAQHDFLSQLGYWDGSWYSSITFQNAYATNGAAPVFYPLFPLLAHGVYTLFVGHVPQLAAGLIVDGIATWLALVALLKATEEFVGARYRWWGVALFITSPAALFLNLFYAEAIFCALAFWAYLFALRRQWLAMGIALGLLTAVKLPAVLVIGLCGLEFMRAYRWKVKEIVRPQALYFLLAPLGFIAYGLYLSWLRHDFLAMFHGYKATSDWSYHIFNPDFLIPIAKACRATLLFLMGRYDYATGLVNAALPFTGLFLLGSLSLFALIKLGPKARPLAIAGLVSVVFFTINSNVVSVHRYLLPCIGLYILPAVLIKRYPRLAGLGYIAAYIGVLLQAILMSLFTGGHFAG